MIGWQPKETNIESNWQNINFQNIIINPRERAKETSKKAIHFRVYPLACSIFKGKPIAARAALPVLLDSFINTPFQKQQNKTKADLLLVAKQQHQQKRASPGQMARAQQSKSRVTRSFADGSRDPPWGTKNPDGVLPLKPVMRAGSRLEASPLRNGYSVWGHESKSTLKQIQRAHRPLTPINLTIIS